MCVSSCVKKLPNLVFLKAKPFERILIPDNLLYSVISLISLYIISIHLFSTLHD